MTPLLSRGSISHITKDGSSRGGPPQGVNQPPNSTLMDARQFYFWPGMTNAIELLVAKSKECTADLPSQTLEPQIRTEATRPFKRIDIRHQKGNTYLIGMDRYSGWPMAASILRKANTKTIIDILGDWFNEHSIPISIRTDGGPQFWGPFDA